MIDLKATLKPGDLFVSYWLADRLMIAFGDHQEIQETEIMSAGGLVPLVRAFAQQVTRIEYFGNFINPEIGCARSATTETPRRTTSVVDSREIVQDLPERRFSASRRVSRRSSPLTADSLAAGQ
jgi:hypothetical protein